MPSSPGICTGKVEQRQGESAEIFSKEGLLRTPKGLDVLILTSDEARQTSPREAILNQTKETDDESISTLLSESSIEDDESTDSAESSLEELEKEFAIRDELLEKLTKGMAPSYAQVMKDNEKAARFLMLQQAQQEKKSQGMLSGDVKSKDKVEEHKKCRDVVPIKMGWKKRASQIFLFDIPNTFQGWATLILYCIAHNSCFYIVDEAIVFPLTKVLPNQDIVDITIVITALILLRMSGGLWEWLNDSTYERVKFDMHNRFRLGRKDASLLRWFHRRHPTFQLAVDRFAFYCIFGSICSLHERRLSMFGQTNMFFQGLPSVKKGILTDVSERVSRLLAENTPKHDVDELTCSAGVCSMEEMHASLTVEDDEYLAEVLSLDSYEKLMGSTEEIVLVSEWTIGMFYLGSAIVAIALIHKLGHVFGEL